MPSRSLNPTSCWSTSLYLDLTGSSSSDICALQQGMLILVISMRDESLYVERDLRACARGYIMKQESGPAMMQAIRQVLAKRIYLSDKMSALILENVVGKRTEASPIKRLSDRELEVFQLIGRGRSTVQIAEALHFEPQDSRGPSRAC